MKWRGITRRKIAEQEFKLGLKEIDCMAIIELRNNFMYFYYVYDVYPDGSLTENKLDDELWVRTLPWAKRKCNELLHPLRINEWKWEQIE